MNKREETELEVVWYLEDMAEFLKKILPEDEHSAVDWALADSKVKVHYNHKKHVEEGK